ncbi:uncharacterized protein J3R85_009495 [Psidium guajava]|nr:uncharacterized protein J3R85_009495 [Psidium guajava]
MSLRWNVAERCSQSRVVYSDPPKSTPSPWVQVIINVAMHGSQASIAALARDHSGHVYLNLVSGTHALSLLSMPRETLFY